MNMGEKLNATGCDFTNVEKATVFLAAVNDFETVNEIYKQCFKSNFPTRATYQAAALPKGVHTEVEAVSIQRPHSSANISRHSVVLIMSLNNILFYNWCWKSIPVTKISEVIMEIPYHRDIWHEWLLNNVTDTMNYSYVLNVREEALII